MGKGLTEGQIWAREGIGAGVGDTVDGAESVDFSGPGGELILRPHHVPQSHVSVSPVGVLSHVFGQIGGLSVGLPTVGTDVDLQVFALLVLRDVIQQALLVRETLVATKITHRRKCMS